MEQDLECGAVVRLLWDFLDDELPSPMHGAIRAHLETCRGCEGHFRFCREFLARLASAPVSSAELSAARAAVTEALRSARA